MFNFTLKKSKEIYKGKIVTLKHDTLLLDNGQEIIREKIIHNKVTAIVPFIEEKKIILIKHYRYPIEDCLWEIPAGIAEKDESLLDCAQRELEEETGFKAAKIEKISSFFPTPGISDEEITVFKAYNLEKNLKNKDKEELINQSQAFTLEELRLMIKRNEIIDSKTLIGLLLVMGNY
jgi:ADP-ribose pyrophosphatase